MKNGFTLIELLGVIVIISILSLISLPIIDNSLNKGKENLQKEQEEQIIKGLKNYYADNPSELSKLSEGETCTFISDLKSNGYLPSDIKDIKKNGSMSGSACIKKNCEDSEDSDGINYSDNCSYEYYLE